MTFGKNKIVGNMMSSVILFIYFVNFYFGISIVIVKRGATEIGFDKALTFFSYLFILF